MTFEPPMVTAYHVCVLLRLRMYVHTYNTRWLKPYIRQTLSHYNGVHML
jgi:hypothetical protein